MFSLNMMDYPKISILLSTIDYFFAEQEEEVILILFYSLGCKVSFVTLCLKVVGWGGGP